MGTQLLLPQSGTDLTPIFGPYQLWANGWVDQDAILYGGRHRPRRHCVRWGPSSPKRGTAPNLRPCLLWPSGWMDQDVSWYKGRPRPDIVMDGDPAQPPLKGYRLTAPPPNFGPCPLWPNGLMTERPIPIYRYRPRPRRLCVSSQPKKTQPQPNFRPTSIVVKRLDV